MAKRTDSEPGKKPARSLSVDDVMINDQLAQRAWRPPQLFAENEALHGLMQKFSHSAHSFLDAVVETVCRLCDAGSGGISFEETLPSGGKVLRWVATCGLFASLRGQSMPRQNSLCGLVLDRDQPLLFARPHRYFSEIDEQLGIEEALLVPWRVGEGFVGTLWVLSRSPNKKFDAEDLRMVESLSTFAQAAVLKERVESEMRKQGERDAAARLANELAHQINNPLQTLTNILELLPADGNGELLQEAKHGVHRIAYLVRGILVSARGAGI